MLTQRVAELFEFHKNVMRIYETFKERPFCQSYVKGYGDFCSQVYRDDQ